jgi:hypothetical protein
MTYEPATKQTPRLASVLIALLAAFLFLLLTSPRLTGQGLHYDEIFQAPGSFAYKGVKPEMFNELSIFGIPLLNMPYCGAIKSAIYGLYLRLLNADFTVFSWRLTGIIFVCLGLFAFLTLVGSRLPIIGLFVFVFFFATDSTLILLSRFDFGPVDLAALFRLTLIALWVVGEISDKASRSNSFFLGFIVGIAVFEKLSSVVLVLPLTAFFLLSERRRSIRHYGAGAVGLLVGSLPLIFVNLYSFLAMGKLVSFSAVEAVHRLSVSDFFTFMLNYFSLANESVFKGASLGHKPYDDLFKLSETILASLMIVLSGSVNLALWKRSQYFRLAGALLACYLSVGVGLFLLPKSTSFHHWIIGTPFHYAAFAMTLVGLYEVKGDSRFLKKLSLAVLIALIAIWAVMRGASLISLERSFFQADAGFMWDPSFTEIGDFAAKRTQDAVFIAADWGVGTQIYCLANGQPKFLFQLFWDYQGIEQLQRIIQNSGKKQVYVVAPNPLFNLIPESTKRILHDSQSLPNWKEVTIEDEIKRLKAVKVGKFVYAGRL